jgi:hypothetical protein
MTLEDDDMQRKFFALTAVITLLAIATPLAALAQDTPPAADQPSA